MIDRHYGNLANDSRDHAVALLDALALRTGRGRYVDVAANASEAKREVSFTLSSASASPSRGRSVDAAPRFCRLTRRRKER